MSAGPAAPKPVGPRRLSQRVYTLDPIQDARWDAFVDAHPAASVFHLRSWVEALQSSYAYQPVVYTTSPPDAPLTNGVLLCAVRSWLTGSRLVSVPFADHCEPLVTLPEDRAAILNALVAASRDWKYVELRPRTPSPWNAPGLGESASFRFHALDLRPALEDLLRRAHPSAIQRKIHRAEREGVSCEEGRSEALLEAFFRLMLQTRRRHGLAPQPLQWFRNLIACFGNRVKIRVAAKDGRPIGSILTLQHGDTLVYKYGCSDARFHSLGAMPFLFWQCIQDAKASNMQTFDLGRSDVGNAGLITFKERLGATPSTLTYLRVPARERRARGWSLRLPARIAARMPDSVLAAAGKLLYRHIG